MGDPDPQEWHLPSDIGLKPDVPALRRIGIARNSHRDLRHARRHEPARDRLRLHTSQVNPDRMNRRAFRVRAETRDVQPQHRASGSLVRRGVLSPALVHRRGRFREIAAKDSEVHREEPHLRAVHRRAVYLHFDRDAPALSQRSGATPH